MTFLGLLALLFLEAELVLVVLVTLLVLVFLEAVLALLALLALLSVAEVAPVGLGLGERSRIVMPRLAEVVGVASGWWHLLIFR